LRHGLETRDAPRLTLPVRQFFRRRRSPRRTPSPPISAATALGSGTAVTVRSTPPVPSYANVPANPGVVITHAAVPGSADKPLMMLSYVPMVAPTLIRLKA